jgi:mannose-6-phosphate isomerase-like protein (cupin superfamily)
MEMLAAMDVAPAVVNHATGESISVFQSGVETNGRYTEGISIYPPSLASSSYHEHPKQDELVSVVAGTLLIRIGGKLQFAGPGASVVIPAGAAHEIANTGAEPAETIWQYRPALRTAEFLAVTAANERSPEGTWRRRFRGMAIAAEFSHEYRRATLPWSLQRPVLALVHHFVKICGEPWSRAIDNSRFDSTSSLTG